MPLTFIKTGETAIVKRIKGNPDLKNQIQNMGIVPEEKITVVANDGKNLIVESKGAKFAFGIEVTNKIDVDINLKENIYDKQKNLS